MDDEQATGMPAWVKTLIGIAVAVAVLVVVMMVLGGGDHGPGRH